MDHHEQQEALETELRGVIARFRTEFNLSLADAVGTIECVKLELFRDQMRDIEDDGI